MRRAKRRWQHMMRVTVRLTMLTALTACATPTLIEATSTAEHPCPPWVEFPADRHSNAETLYLGCSIAANLRATVENPEDLQHGRALAPANGARASIGAGQYETGQVRPLPSGGPPTPTIVLSGGGGGMP